MSKDTPHTPPSGGRPTLKTVAQATGFAVTTVSRALAQDPAIAESTRAKVAAAAADLGYVPDRAAQRLRTGRTNVITLVLDPHSEIISFTGTMIEGIAERLSGTRYHINITHYRLDTDPLIPIRNIVRNRLADGVIFGRTERNDARARFCMEQEFPFVTHGRTEIRPGHPWLDYDNAAFARAAVHRLAARGRRRLSIIPPAPQFTFYSHMTEGFAQGVSETGVAQELPAGTDLMRDPRDLSAHFRDRFQRPDPPDGIICPGEIAALAVNAAVADSGRVLGQDVDILAKQTSGLFDLFRPKVDTIFEDLREAGHLLADLLLRRIDGAPAEGLQHLQRPPDPV